ncbi:hypothetical protein [Occallatibacter riparius]|uniref:Uncharacterized protein n=1 Tax=Occallatibacter riparius TaxID=1002689 RepID=A0A9J7BWJ3_9BACT|nr:hypothetical protein [Occallatibacter riparius]UWZ85246.1 hypothetical protein MOP44_04720 [Occallatibacter riparius]
MMPTHLTWRVCVLVALAYVCAESPAQDIYYTGKLFGYYRIEPGESDHLIPVKAFLAHEYGRKGLLLGMGDNFGPEFGASILSESPNEHCPAPVVPNRQRTAPETLYKADGRYAPAAECDNVMNFLMQAGYRALVPGREDFIYSASWLIRMAGEVRIADERGLVANPEGRLEFLAANLRLSGGGSPVKGSSPTCPLLFAQFPLSLDATPCTTDEAAPTPTSFDWMDRLDKAKTEGMQAGIVGALKGEEGEAFQPESDSVSARAVKNEFSILKAAWGKCDLGKIDQRATTDPENLKDPVCVPEKGRQPVREESDDLKDYWQEFKNRLVVVFGKDGPERIAACASIPECKTIDLNGHPYRYLLISRKAIDAAQRQILRDIGHELCETGYTVAGPAGHRVLIVGVVGKDTMSAISQSNLRVCLGSAGPEECSGKPLKGERTVKVFNPAEAVVMAVRAASLMYGPFSKVIVMAQMPAPEAEVMASMVRYRMKEVPNLPAVDAVLAEAQPDYQTGNVTLAGVETKSMTPVFTPPVLNPDDVAASRKQPEMYGSAAMLSINFGTYQNSIVHAARFPRRVSGKEITTTYEVRRLMQKSKLEADKVIPCPIRTANEASVDDCPFATVLAILSSLQRASPPADVVLMERRDIYLGKIPEGYGGGDDYDTLHYCPGLAEKDLRHCLLRVALDRILWKGDYVERVAVTGADLMKIVAASSARAAEDSDLRVTDLYRQWLVTYGLTQPALTNLTQLFTDSEPQWIPADKECKRIDQSDSSKTVYCINGRPIASDQIYWVATNDDLAEDKNVYPQLGALPAQNRGVTSDFQTKIAALALEGMRKAGRDNTYSSDEDEIAFVNAAFQQQRLFQIDFNKVVLSFNNNHALGPTDQIPASLQGVADSRAAVPHSQDVDLEGALRLTSNHAYFKPMSLGTQTSSVYERSVKGNLSGSPESVSYPQNNATFGGFLQYTLLRHPMTRTRALPRDLLTLTPHQFQTQVNKQRLFIGFTAKDASGKTIPGQLAVALPIVSSFNDRLGYRHEWGVRKTGSLNPGAMDAGSYGEGGFEYSFQNDILESVTLANGTTTFTCTAKAEVDIATCFKKSSFPIGPSTTVVGHPATQSLHTPGAYWDVHLSRGLDMGALKNLKPALTLVSESQGDWFFGRPASAQLPTQTNYAVTWNSSLNVPLWGNLSFGPTYNVFFYQPQLSAVHEQIRTFSVALRWYMARDQRVPMFWTAPRMAGPSSADQTKSSAKSK